MALKVSRSHPELSSRARVWTLKELGTVHLYICWLPTARFFLKHIRLLESYLAHKSLFCFSLLPLFSLSLLHSLTLCLSPSLLLFIVPFCSPLPSLWLHSQADSFKVGKRATDSLSVSLWLKIQNVRMSVYQISPKDFWPGWITVELLRSGRQKHGDWPLHQERLGGNRAVPLWKGCRQTNLGVCFFWPLTS